jgi:class 3 adenylate cyclase
VLAVRVSGADPRPRHRGVSHHTEAVLSVAGDRLAVPFPAGSPFASPRHPGAFEVDVTGWREACAGLLLEHMGRGADDDPWFFAAAFAAGRHAHVLATRPAR